MAMLLGKKVGMTQVYDKSGDLLPVTVIQAGPCTVMQVKTAVSVLTHTPASSVPA